MVKGLKRLTLLMVVATLVVAMVGCTQDKKPEATADTGAQQATSGQATTSEAPTAEAVKNGQVTLKQDEPAPPIVLPTVDGSPVALADFKGQYVFVNFWATWCGFCEAEIPDLQKFDDANDDITVLMVNSMEPAKDVAPYIEKMKIKMPVVLDEKGVVTQQYMVTSYPTTFVIDKQGKLIGVVQGMVDEKKLEQIKTFIHDKYPK